MSREIRLKAWIEEERKFINAEKLSIFPGVIYVYDLDADYEYQIKPEHLLQFAGLKERSDNGKELYEGDIVKSGNGRVWIIRNGEYSRQDAGGKVNGIGWYLEPKETDFGCIEFRPSNYEVIGNIYENPNLLAGN